MGRVLWLLLGVAALLALGACAGLSPEQKETFRQWAQDALADGRLSQEQFEAIADALQGGTDWIARVLDTGISVVLAYFGVNWMRDRRRMARGEPAGPAAPAVRRPSERT